ncbi:VPA1267 family protein [Photobacterium sp. Alg240-V54]|uniref:VPA1267 family protein n=1 Tax=Photobacterium sp. Alg240-V54 TaxID=2305995 RepID=UPI0013D2ADE2|nr:VPA1267 family protein [Photobacterium sp. Alg240-V54]
MSKKLSGKQKGEGNFINFLAWKEAQTDDGFRAIVNLKDGVLGRNIIAKACGFGVSVLRQNPKVKAALIELESQLVAKGILPTKVEKESSLKSNDSKLLDQNKRKQSQLVVHTHRLESRITELEAENEALRRKLDRFEALNSSLIDIGWAPL